MKLERTLKLAFDIVVAFLLINALIWIILVLFIIATIDTQSFGFFTQKRVGKNGRIFQIYKIRTMIGNYESAITSSDKKITNIGVVLRKLKLDELPQLFNVIIGDMSFVGPRPDVEQYYEGLSQEERIILSVRPGITGPAQIKYKNEDEILLNIEDPEEYYKKVIWKDKVKMNMKYVKEWSFFSDIKYMLDTVVGIFK